MEPPSFSIQTRSRGLLQDDPADSSQSTPSLSQTAHHRQDGQYVLPTTPEQMEEIILARIAQVTSESARSRSPASFYDARQNFGEDLNRDVNSFHRQSTPKEVPHSLYRNTSTISCNMLKANKLSENGHDNYKRKEMILKVLQTEDLLTMITNMRPPPTCSDSNPTGYSPRRMINNETGQHSISADVNCLEEDQMISVTVWR